MNCAMLYTDRRFAPFAFYQACLNVFTIAGAVSLWRVLGVYGFAIGYTAGAWVQLAVVYYYAHAGLDTRNLPPSTVHWREILGRPLAVSLYAASLALNIVFTRAWATHIGPGMAAALDYCMRGVGVPLAFLVSPISNSLLPEIARLRSQLRLREAFRLIDRTLGMAALAAVGGCAVAMALRQPAIAILFQRGNFTAESTALVSTVFLGLGAQHHRMEPAGINGPRTVRIGPAQVGTGRVIYPRASERRADSGSSLSKTPVDRLGRIGGTYDGVSGLVHRRPYHPEAVGCAAPINVASPNVRSPR